MEYLEVELMEHVNQTILNPEQVAASIQQESDNICHAMQLRETARDKYDDQDLLRALEQHLDKSMEISMRHIEFLQSINQEKTACRDSLSAILQQNAGA